MAAFGRPQRPDAPARDDARLAQALEALGARGGTRGRDARIERAMRDAEGQREAWDFAVQLAEGLDAAKQKTRRQPVPYLDDASPIHEQLDPYYLEREERGLYNAPLEWMSPREDQPPGRPDRPDDPHRERTRVGALDSDALLRLVLRALQERAGRG